MSSSYDKYYQTEDLFGQAYPELIAFFDRYPKRGKVLDLGCGQGRDAIALARLGYQVTGLDSSSLGIQQMMQLAEEENLSVQGEVADIHAFHRFDQYDMVLLDSMFHFGKKEKEKEIALVKSILAQMKTGSVLVVCIQDSGDKVSILENAIHHEKPLEALLNQKIKAVFEDRESGHKNETPYRIIAVVK